MELQHLREHPHSLRPAKLLWRRHFGVRQFTPAPAGALLPFFFVAARRNIPHHSSAKNFVQWKQAV
jgi:hypothetical protein